MSQDLTIGDLSEIIKFKLNSRIEMPIDKISTKDKIVFFNESISLLEGTTLRDLYIQRREDDGWLYLDFLVEGHTETS